ncbi:MAG: hypothetical protein HYY42_05880, partial [Chloroflexi bacterium]|nr:hypothetical protein [Chloroflexota bacterium]
KAVQKDALHWTVIATVPGVGAKGADVTIETTGQGGVTGQASRRVASPGSVEWQYTFIDTTGGVSVTVRRLDTDACARVAFKAGGAPTAAAPSATASTSAPRAATLRDLVDRARTTLGWPATEPRGGPGRRSDTGADQWVHVVQSGGATVTITISVRDFGSADYAAGFYTSYVLFSRELGPTIHRGLKAFRDAKAATRPFPGFNRDDSGMAIFQAAASVYMFEAAVSCPPSPPDCAPAVPQREIDALLDAAAALGFIPPGTLK